MTFHLILVSYRQIQLNYMRSKMDLKFTWKETKVLTLCAMFSQAVKDMIIHDKPMSSHSSPIITTSLRYTLSRLF